MEISFLYMETSSGWVSIVQDTVSGVGDPSSPRPRPIPSALSLSKGARARILNTGLVYGNVHVHGFTDHRLPITLVLTDHLFLTSPTAPQQPVPP